MAALTMARPVGQAGPMGEVPDPQVPEKAKRRTYTAKYKRDILAEYEACDRDGKGALLRPPSSGRSSAPPRAAPRGRSCGTCEQCEWTGTRPPGD